MGWIYKITNTYTGNIYIGQSRRGAEIRWKEHVQTKDHYSTALAHALRKYPEEYFTLEVVEEVSDEMLDDRERYWIEFFDSYKNGYNCTLGGESRHVVDYDKIRELWSEGYSVKEISEIYGCGKCTVSRILQHDASYSLDESRRRGDALGVREVVKYSLDGDFLHVYNSIAEAAQDVGGFGSDIVNACRGKNLTAAGYQWRYVEDEPPDPYRNPAYMAVDQYNLEGNYIQTFESIVMAAEMTGTNKSTISHNCRGECKRAGGYQWRYAGDEPPEQYKIKSVKPVVRCDLDWNPLESYPSMAAAARELDIDISSICACCNGRKKTYKGYRWRYAE